MILFFHAVLGVYAYNISNLSASQIESTGVLNVVNVDPSTDIIALQGVDNSPQLTVDVTLQNGTEDLLNTVDFQGASNLQNVRTIYVPQFAELLLSFEEAVKDRREPALQEGVDPDFDADADLYQFEFIKNVPGQSPGVLRLDMSGCN